MKPMTAADSLARLGEVIESRKPANGGDPEAREALQFVADHVSGILERTASTKVEGSYNVASSGLDLLRVQIELVTEASP